MKSKSNTSFLCLAALTTACLSPQLFALTVTDFAPVPALEGDPIFYGSGGANTCWGVNSDGVVVGTAASSAGVSHSFAYYSETDQLVDIGTFGGYDSAATAINEGGNIVGQSNDADYYSVSHVYQFDGYSMDPLSGLSGDSYAAGINSASEICGSTGSRAFFRNAFGTYAPPGGADNYMSWASAINDQSMITGYFQTSSPYIHHAFLWDTGSNTWTDLGTLGGSSSWGYAVNSSGHVVGASALSNATTSAFLYSNGTMTNLGSLVGVDGGSCAYGISDQGHVVGTSSATDGAHAFIYKDGTMHDLHTLAASYLVQDETSEGFTILEEARAIGRSADASGRYVVVGNGWYRNAQGDWIRQGYILHIAD
jgi:probable HAF family extracellular repeat protein